MRDSISSSLDFRNKDLILKYILFFMQFVSNYCHQCFADIVCATVDSKRDLWSGEKICAMHIPYSFDCKPQIIVFFHFMRPIIKGGWQSRAPYIFFFTLWKGIDDAQFFLDYLLSTKISSHSVIFSITYTLHHWWDYDEQKAVLVV